MTAATDTGPGEMAALIAMAESNDPAERGAIERELERLCLAGNGTAQRAGVILLYHACVGGDICFAEFAFRAEQVIRASLTTGTIRDLFLFTGDEQSAREAHAELLCILDQMADNGSEDAANALADLADLLPPWLFQRAKELTALPAPGWPAYLPAEYLIDDDEPLPPPPPYGLRERLRGVWDAILDLFGRGPISRILNGG